jgi:hypothetical protein
MGNETKDFATKRDLDRFLKKASPHIRVINVTATKKCSWWIGPFENKKSYTLTYETASLWADSEHRAANREGWIMVAILAVVIIFLVFHQ